LTGVGFHDLPAEIKLDILQRVHVDQPAGVASLLPLRFVSRVFNMMVSNVYSRSVTKRAQLVVKREEWYEDDGNGGYLQRLGDPVAEVEAGTSSFKETAFHFTMVSHLQIDTAILDVEHLEPVIDKICEIVLKCENIRRLTVTVDQMRASFVTQIRRQIQDIVDYAMKNKRKGYNVALEFVGIAAQG
jgi:hypothetical protein